MRTFVSIVILSFLFAPIASAQPQFTVASFNTLHYGWGATTAAKDAVIQQLGTVAHAIVLQEIMPQANFAGLQTAFPPATADFIVSQNSYGTARYQERYVIILSKAMFDSVGTFEFPQLAAPAGPFSRPPMMAAVRPNGSARTYYIADFHAIWGRSQAQRTAEAAAVCTSFAANTPEIAFAGDWNLSAAQILASAPCVANAQPAGLTTLNRAGTLYSSSYDHGVVFAGSTLGIAAANVLQPANTQTWRASVSDHVPVTVTYTYQ